MFEDLNNQHCLIFLFNYSPSHENHFPANVDGLTLQGKGERKEKGGKTTTEGLGSL